MTLCPLPTSCTVIYLHILDCLSLTQVVSEPTHQLSSGYQTLIDLALLSSPDHLISCEIVPPLGNSNSDSGRVQTILHKNDSQRQIWHYNRADSELIYPICIYKELLTRETYIHVS